ncbi:hypothetical protein D9611_012856 [Ephemerocybe angulata]|uniref:DUF6533 domain-containing protein n=1 Tax=Ephemerocybe angulata TaxID=980116 RepID=A0A8H5BCS8_9AGAR|nr:hypothetical protein D9611_012856 [Tulosesus angulatus]
MDVEAITALRNAIINGYRATTITNYLTVSGYALVVADYLHTFPDEVRLMWPSPLSLPKVLFFTLRYYIFPHSVLAALYGQVVGLSPKACKAAFYHLGISTSLCAVLSEAILYIRVYAFSGRNKKILAWSLCQSIGVWVSSYIILARFLASVEYFEWPFGNATCLPVAGKSYLLGVVFAILLTSVFVTMCIMAWIAYSKHRTFNSTLVKIFYRDGIFYFICLSILASANIFVAFAAPEGYKFLFILPESDIHVILATRMLLHLREWAERETVVESGRSGGARGGGMGMEFSTTLQRCPSPMEFHKRSDPGGPWKSVGSCNTPTTLSTGRWTATTLDDYDQDSHGRAY